MATTDFTQYRSELRDGYRRLGAAIPDTMHGFEGLHRAAVADGALPRATKELMALAIGIAARCDGCITLHAHGRSERAPLRTKRGGDRCGRADGRWARIGLHDRGARRHRRVHVLTRLTR